MNTDDELQAQHDARALALEHVTPGSHRWPSVFHLRHL
jgi:hypothetical protein